MKINTSSIPGSLAGADSMGGSTPDGRRSIRYPLRAPVVFQWADTDGAQREAKGSSRDISESGAFIISRTCPQIGAGIILTFRLSYPSLPARPRAIEMTGRVARIELQLENKGSWGFAVTSTQVILLESEDH